MPWLRSPLSPEEKWLQFKLAMFIYVPAAILIALQSSIARWLFGQDYQPGRAFKWFFTLLPFGCHIVYVIWAVRRTRAIRRHAIRIATGCCLNCGYDLRASPGRCPECGKFPVGATPASPGDAAVGSC